MGDTVEVFFPSKKQNDMEDTEYQSIRTQNIARGEMFGKRRDFSSISTTAPPVLNAGW